MPDAAAVWRFPWTAAGSLRLPAIFTFLALLLYAGASLAQGDLPPRDVYQDRGRTQGGDSDDGSGLYT